MTAISNIAPHGASLIPHLTEARSMIGKLRHMLKFGIKVDPSSPATLTTTYHCVDENGKEFEVKHVQTVSP